MDKHLEGCARNAGASRSTKILNRRNKNDGAMKALICDSGEYDKNLPKIGLQRARSLAHSGFDIPLLRCIRYNVSGVPGITKCKASYFIESV